MIEINQTVSKKLRALSFAYETMGDRYRAMSFGRAATKVAAYDEAVDEMNDVKKIEGVGKSTEEVIKEVLATGTCMRLEKLKKVSAPPSISEFAKMRGVGPKGALRIFKVYGIETMKELGELIQQGEMPEGDIVVAYEEAAKRVERLSRAEVLEAALPLLKKTEQIPDVYRASLAGSLRRGVLWVKDVDIVICVDDDDREVVIESVRNVLGITGKGRVKLAGEISVGEHKRHVDVSLTSPETWGATLLYLTGSKDHNVLLRSVAKEKGFTLNEYGIWRGDECVVSKTEKEIYEVLGLSYMKPSEREVWRLKKRLDFI